MASSSGAPAPKRNKRHRTEDGGEVADAGTNLEADLYMPSLFTTLTVESDAGKVRLRELAEVHGSGYEGDADDTFRLYGGLDFASSLPPEQRHAWRAYTYEQKRDAESAAVDNSGGRALRNRTVPNHNGSGQDARCIRCKEAGTRCSLTKNRTLPCTRCLKLGIDCLDSNKSANTSFSSSVVASPQVPVDPNPHAPVDPSPQAAVDPSPQAPVDRSPQAPVIVSPQSPASPEPPKSPSQIIKSEVPMARPFAAERTTTGAGTSMSDPILLDDSPPGSPVAATTSLTHQTPIHARQHPASTSGGLGISRTDPVLPTTASTSRVLIDTDWIYPINFKYIGNDPLYPCHFCADFRYGLWGCPGKLPADAERIVKSNPLGEPPEVAAALTRNVTRMCVHCALYRLRMSRCKTHRLQEFGVRSETKLHEYNVQVFHTPKNRRITKGVYPSCSLCPQAAFWRCCADQLFDTYGRVLEPKDGKGKGCGLLLCDGCHSKVEADMGRLKPTSIARTYDFTPRADAEFLFPGSLLHQAYFV